MNNRLKPYIIAFLAFCVLSSKHIIIYNEELLVTITFFAFVAFVFFYFGNTLKESLDERSLSIKGELQNFFVLKKESLGQLYLEHDKVSSLKKGLHSLSNFTLSEISIASKRGVEALNFILSQHMKQKLNTLLLSTLPLQLEWQQRMATSQWPLVLVNLEKKWKKDKKSRSWDPKIVHRAMESLRHVIQR